MKNMAKEKNRSIVDEYDEYHNSFDKHLRDYDKSFLYPVIITEHGDSQFSFFSSTQKFQFKNDSLYHISATNTSELEIPLFHTNLYISKWRNKFYYIYHTESQKYLLRIYSITGFKIVMKFLKKCPDLSLTSIDETKIKGLIDVVRINGESAFLTSLLASEQIEHNTKIDISSIQKKKMPKTYSGFQSVNKWIFLFSLINEVLDRIDSDIPHTTLRDFYKIIGEIKTYKSFMSVIQKNYDSFDNHLKDCCCFFSDNYKYVYNQDLVDESMDADMCALANIVTHHYDYRILNYPYFNLRYWKNKKFDDFVQYVAKEICQNKNKRRWFFHQGTERMFYLKSLLFFNWAYLPDKTLKSAFAIWLYYILYNNLETSFPKDKNFYKLLLCYIIYENQLTFLEIIDNIEFKTDKDLSNDNILSSSIYYYSDGCSISRNKYTYKQKVLLSYKVEKVMDFSTIKTNKPSNIDEQEFIRIGQRVSNMIYVFIKNMLESPDYTNNKIVNLVANMSDYYIPDYYKRRY